LFSVKQVAKEYGGKPSDPISVADAYASQSYQPRFQAAALEGCLDGFRGR
jgi:hypothetical protein